METPSTQPSSLFFTNDSDNDNAGASLPPSAAPTIFKLPEIINAESVRTASRDAWRVFVEQSNGWGKAELVLWSYGLYAPAARWSPRAEDDASSLEDLFDSLDGRFAERIVETARARVIDLLASFAIPGQAELFADAARADGRVTRCVDANGNSAWIPSPVSTSFGDRIVALVVADVLNNPADFANGAVCDRCHAITVGNEGCHLHENERVSGIVTRGPTSSNHYSWAS